MKTLKLKTTHKVVKDYYLNIEKAILAHEGNVAPHFATLLRYVAKQFKWELHQEYPIKRVGLRPIFVDGVLLDDFHLTHGWWEAKDNADDLIKEIKEKFRVGYPSDNILFQSPKRCILYQNNKLVLDLDTTKPLNLIRTLKLFLEYQPPAFGQWELAVEEFKDKVPELAHSLKLTIEKEHQNNEPFRLALTEFTDLARQTINPNISNDAIDEMLIQHLLTERLFRKVFNHPDFNQRNVIAVELEKVITALTSQYFSRAEFLKNLDPFYNVIETTATTIQEFSQKQTFLNKVYEKFFQGFSVKIADTHGIVYTPQPIVDFMVRSVDELLKTEFGKTLGDEGVHILDPFTGTGNFILRTMREIPRIKLPYKYANELHCNEVMLLPYYIAALNIEHEYLDLTGRYAPFENICLVDTFELSEPSHHEGKQKPNTARVDRQQDTNISVIIGNPPYNAKQQNENDNNKNRTHSVIDKRVRETYAKDSTATNKNALSDVYVKAIRWAADRIGEEGIVAFVTNNSFIDGIAFDGIRKHLGQDFDYIYVLDLGGNVRQNPKLSGTTHNVFGIQVGVSINLFIRCKTDKTQPQLPKLYYASVDKFWRKEEKYVFLNQTQSLKSIAWQELKPNKKHTWLTTGLESEFETFIPIGNKETKSGKIQTAIFINYSRGVGTSRDAWACNFRVEDLVVNIRRLITTYNTQVGAWEALSPKPSLDSFVSYVDTEIKWSASLKQSLRLNKFAVFDRLKLRRVMYRPFVNTNLFFDRLLNNEGYRFLQFLPTPKIEKENQIICVSGVGGNKPFQTLLIPSICDLGILEATQCFPFYTYDKEGSNRRENITDWSLGEFQNHYQDTTITKWDTFYYIYGLLHHPDYREKYAANLRRQLPHIPYTPEFWPFSYAGESLADLHLNYESKKEYPLEFTENPKADFSYLVEKMKLSKDRTEIVYNNFLTLRGIPLETFEYKLGNRSALHWILDQYRVKVDKRSGIENNPNNSKDETYIIRLIGQIITVSLETVKIVDSLPKFE